MGTLTVREMRYTVAQRGSRTRVITLATTLVNPERYPAGDDPRRIRATHLAGVLAGPNRR